MDKYYDTNSTRLTTVEIGSLWSSYILESMVHHVFSYFSNNVNDIDIRAYVDLCRVSSRFHINALGAVFQKEKLPTPRGTASEDVNVNAPRLFSDKFYIIYIKHMANFALLNYAISYARSSRDDIRQLFRDKLVRLQEVDQIGTQIMISKGIYSSPPDFDIYSGVDFIEDKNFFAGYFGEKRPLSILEINQLFFNLKSNILGKALMIGFSRAAKSKDIQDYILKGKEISDKYIQMFSDKLQKEDTAIPNSLESEVYSITNGESPFSDRLMLSQVVFLNTYGIGNYGMALSQSQRRDLTVMYGKIMVEVGLYADNRADLLIQNRWLEQPPLPK